MDDVNNTPGEIPQPDAKVFGDKRLRGRPSRAELLDRSQKWSQIVFLRGLIAKATDIKLQDDGFSFVVQVPRGTALQMDTVRTVLVGNPMDVVLDTIGIMKDYRGKLPRDRIVRHNLVSVLKRFPKDLILEGIDLNKDFRAVDLSCALIYGDVTVSDTRETAIAMTGVSEDYLASLERNEKWCRIVSALLDRGRCCIGTVSLKQLKRKISESGYYDLDPKVLALGLQVAGMISPNAPGRKPDDIVKVKPAKVNPEERNLAESIGTMASGEKSKLLQALSESLGNEAEVLAKKNTKAIVREDGRITEAIESGSKPES